MTAKHEIEWGETRGDKPIGADPAAALAAHLRKNETPEQRRRRQEKLDEQLRAESAARRRRVVTIAGVLLLLGAGAAAALADRQGVIALPFIHRVAAAPTSVPSAAARSEISPNSASAPPAPSYDTGAPTVTPLAQPLPLAGETPPAQLAAAPAVDATQLRALSDRVAHAEAGIGVIERERSEKLASLATEDQLLRGSYAPDRTHRRDDSLYVQNQANAKRALELQRLAQARQPGAELAYSNQVTLIQNVQAQIQNTITNETHDAEVLRSLDARLAKAIADRDRAKAELATAQGAGTP